MKPIHPAFDMATQTWFAGDREAPTLAALKAALPPRTRIIGYFPNGYNGVRPSPPPGEISKRFIVHRPPEPFRSPQKKKTVEVINPPARPSKKSKPRKFYYNAGRGPGAKYDYNAILNLWAAGKTAPQIAAQLGYQRWLGVSSVIHIARKGGDPRAKYRGNSRSKHER